MASSNGDFVFSLRASADQNSGEETMLNKTEEIEPSFSLKVLVIFSTSVSEGLSLTKRIANFREINLAVDGCLASIFKSSNPSS